MCRGGGEAFFLCLRWRNGSLSVVVVARNRSEAEKVQKNFRVVSGFRIFFSFTDCFTISAEAHVNHIPERRKKYTKREIFDSRCFYLRRSRQIKARKVLFFFLLLLWGHISFLLKYSFLGCEK